MLSDSFAAVVGVELWLENAYIPEFTKGSWTNHAPRRKRKLLLAKKDIAKLAGKSKETGVTLIPISLYFKDGYAKVQLGVARGKKLFDKRESIKERDANRDIIRGLTSNETNL